MTKTATKTVALSTPALKGKRAIAFGAIAALSFAEDMSRGASLANMRVALGSSPSEAEVKAARVRWIVGRVASRLTPVMMPRGTTSTEQRLMFADDLVNFYAKPATEGKATRPLRKGQKGRRTATQQRVVRAAEEACSVFFAELNLSNAKTNAERAKEKATRAPSMAGSGKGKAATPSHAELVQPAAPVTSDDYVQHMQTQLSQLVAYDQKHAKKRPTTHGAFAEALLALKQLANKAANDYAERQAAAKAKANA